MVTDTIIKLLRNAKSGLNTIYKRVVASKTKEEELSSVELKSIIKELRAVRKQLSIVEEEIE